ncbi:putative gti1/Pac2 family protein [Lyophyllum shimeji]|uniref:Gti1/Pac2 family protein n=1 Tax=Lyophyllum shimeji TaxID=47721 RepID=A0A9P3UU68_LYOSH|nr:putative gti1/Pac2 family protein [Lyophyllum shimeji]
MSAPPSNPQPTSTWTEPPWSGWIETTGDALLILEAARRGLIPRVTRRLVDSERKMITSGSVFVFDEDESGIKRWTDGFFWSPSRILGNFLLYRETDKRGSGHRGGKSDASSSDPNEQYGSDGVKVEGQSLSRPKSDDGHLGVVDKHRERTLMGSLTNSYKFKPDGLMKKTFSLTIGGVAQHLISYYKIEDVTSGRLRSPSSLPELASLDISPEYLDKTHFRNPPKVEIGVDGIPRYRGEADDIDSAPPLLTAPLSTGPPLLTDGRVAEPSNASRRGKRFDPYAAPASTKRPRRHTKSSVDEPSTPTEQLQQQQSPTLPQPPTPANGYVDPNITVASPPAQFPLPYGTVPNYYPMPGYPALATQPHAQPPPPHMYYPAGGASPQQAQQGPPPAHYHYGYPPGAPTTEHHQQSAQGTPPPAPIQQQAYYPYPPQPQAAPYAGAWAPYATYPTHMPPPPPQSSIASQSEAQPAGIHASSGEGGG